MVIFFPAYVDISDNIFQDILNKDRFWTEELLKANKDRLFGCAYNALNGIRSGDLDAKISGLVSNHAYSVLRAVEYNNPSPPPGSTPARRRCRL